MRHQTKVRPARAATRGGAPAPGRRLPSGWWVAVALALGAALWVLILWAVFG